MSRPLSILILSALLAACESPGPGRISGPPAAAPEDPAGPDARPREDPPPADPPPGDPAPDDPAPEDSPPAAPAVDISSGALRTSSDRYVLKRGRSGWEVTISYTYENPTGGPVFMTTCNGPHPPMLERWNGSRWVPGWHPFHLLCLGPPLRIEAGSTHSDELWLFAGYPSSNDWPRFETEDWEGLYRMVWWPRSSYQDRPPFGDLLPLEHRVSAPFELVEGE